MKKRCLSMLILTVMVACFGWAGGQNEGPVDTDTLRVILIIPGNLGDKSFFDSANRGLDLVAREFGAETKVIEAGVDSTKWEPALYDAIDGDWDIIITGSSMTELLNQVAPQYPDQRFINFDTSIVETPNNVYSMFYATNDIGFLAGTVAALVTTSDLPLSNDEATIGFLGGMDIPGINDFLVGYIEGALNINPDIQVLISYAGDFNDPAKGKELSLVQYNAGADIIYNVAGGTGLGLMDAAKAANGYAIGVDSDQAMLFRESDPQKASHIVTSTIKRIDQSVLRAVSLALSGELPFGTHEVLGVKEGGVGLAKNEFYDAVMSDELKARVEAVTQELVAGQIEVSSAFGMESEQINALRERVSRR
ncbi:BMP family ABC transporter substrate-binding protein [Sediminispirochaeta bajacaliforniensis]|uniref:BMP family ABC transporter substrate-binding protein n=1 Tax=Sediminispirochaeta bajacaliforniensis TaxID=148 RepID=UPI00037DE854|nr:BMP family ABC transporter substrate-binding protein [Sediminispirochaeta bajacaliforniensis]